MKEVEEKLLSISGGKQGFETIPKYNWEECLESELGKKIKSKESKGSWWKVWFTDLTSVLVEKKLRLTRR